MKRLFYLLTLISFHCFGQGTTPNGFTRYYSKSAFSELWGVNRTNVAINDTLLSPTGIGETRFRTADSTMYIAISMVSGTKRWRAGSGGGVVTAEATVKAFSSVTTLKASSFYTTPGELVADVVSGGRRFKWNPTSTATDDNGVTTVQVTGVTTGRWERIFRGPVRADEVGVKTDNTDQTTLLNSIMANSFVKELSFDADSVKVDGTFNAQGKKIVFRNDAKLIGSGTVQNPLVEADPLKQVFGTGLTVTGLLNNQVEAKWFGFISNSTTDNKPILKKAIAASANYSSLHLAANLANDNTNLGPYYYFSDSVAVDKPMIIYGDGMGKTVLSFPNSAGLWFKYSSSGSILRDMRLKGRIADYSATGFNSNTKHGVINEGINRFERIYFTSWDGDGLYIHGNTGIGTNTNLSVVANCVMFWNGRNGLTIIGPDANQMTIEHNDFTLNKRFGYADSSFLGNLFISNHTATNGNANTGGFSIAVAGGVAYYCLERNGPGSTIVKPGVTSGWENYWEYGYACPACLPAWDSTTEWWPGGSRIFAGGNQNGVAIGEYKEGDELHYVNQGNTVFYGGFAAEGGQRALAIGARQGALTALGFQTYKEANRVAVYLRNQNTDGSTDSYFGIRDDSNNVYLGFNYYQPDKYLRITAGGINNSPAFLFSSLSPPSLIGLSSMPANGNFAFASGGLSLANPSGNFRRFGYADAVPTTGEHAAGEVLIYNGAIDSIVLFKCTVSGTPGTWVTVMTHTGGGGGGGGSSYAVTNEADNRILTSTGAGTGNAEANLTFNSAILTVTARQIINGPSGEVPLTLNSTGAEAIRFQDGTAPFVTYYQGGTWLGWAGYGFGPTDYEFRNRVIGGAIKFATENTVRMELSSAGILNLGAYSGTGNRIPILNSSGDLGRGSIDPANVVQRSELQDSLDAISNGSIGNVHVTGDSVLVSVNPTTIGAKGIYNHSSDGSITVTKNITSTDNEYNYSIPSTKLSSGTYTPTATAVDNVSSVTAQQCHYSRNGNQVIVYGYVSITITSTGVNAGQFSISLPVASNFTATDDDAIGTATIALDGVGTVTADPVNDVVKISVKSVTTSATAVRFSFAYTVK